MFVMAGLTESKRKEIARKFHAIERAGTKSQLAESEGISRVELYAIAREFPPSTFENEETPGSEQRGGFEASA